MGRKRRGSQAFTFEQSEETLLQNEKIVKLYQNKTFEPPDPVLLETIREEAGDGQTGSRRVKRGENEDGVLVLGVNKARRVIEEYRFWKQDDKEKNKKRKLKITKQWKGRKRLKTKPLNPELEQRLVALIADRVPSDEEEGTDTDNPHQFSTQCVWEASSPLLSSRSSINSHREKEISQPGEDVHSSPESPQYVSLDESSPTPSIPLSKNLSKENYLIEREEVQSENDVLSKLQGVIPESELEELLQCDDFLFCSSKDSKSKTKPPVKTTLKEENSKEFKGKGDELPVTKVVKKKKTRKCTPQGSKPSVGLVLRDVTNQQEEPSSNDKKKRRKEESSEKEEDVPRGKARRRSVRIANRRKSYSLEDGGARYSLDGSRRNSVLTVSGEREINISMPDSVRRSLAEPRDLPKPDTIPRVALPVPGFISSDEEEELIISGNLRKKTKTLMINRETRKARNGVSIKDCDT